MGFFDFLHGVPNQKSEAELYMEKRNKEYARRAAAYKKREAMMINQEGLFGNLFTPSQQQTYIRPTNVSSQKPIRTQIQCSVNETKQVLNSSKSSSDCNQCGTSNSIYDSKNLDIFLVENAFAKAAERTVTASGNIVRGGFSVGDKVEVKTTLETRVVTINKIFRQGQTVQYANTSSGKIAIVLSNAADVLVRKGDTINKKK